MKDRVVKMSEKHVSHQTKSLLSAEDEMSYDTHYKEILL